MRREMEDGKVKAAAVVDVEHPLYPSLSLSLSFDDDNDSITRALSLARTLLSDTHKTLVSLLVLTP